MQIIYKSVVPDPDSGEKKSQIRSRRTKNKRILILSKIEKAGKIKDKDLPATLTLGLGLADLDALAQTGATVHVLGLEISLV